MADLTIHVDLDASGVAGKARLVKSDVAGIGDAAEKSNKRIRETSSLAAQDMGKMQETASRAQQALSILGSVGAAGFAAIVAGAVAAAKAIFELSKFFADAGKSVSNLQKQTGFAVETVSALESQFRRTKNSGEEFREGLKNLVKTIGDAANGSKEAVAKMARLGIDPVKAVGDLDGALKQILLRIISLKNPVEQGNAAIDAFGETGYKLLPFIKSFNGDMDTLIKRARDLGTVMREEDVRASEEFDRAMDDAHEAVRGMMMMLGREFLPTVVDVFNWITQVLKDNRNDTQSWAVDAGDFIRGIAAAWRDARDAVNEYAQYAAMMSPPVIGANAAGVSNSDLLLMNNPLGAGYLALRNYGRDARLRQQQMDNNVVRMMGDPGTYVDPKTLQRPYFTPPVDIGKAAKAAKSATPKLTEEQKEAARQAKMLDDTIRDLNLRLEFYGEKTEVAAIKQSLLRAGIDIENNALAKQAISLANTLDWKEANAEIDEQRNKALNEFNKLQQSIKNTGYDERVSLGGIEKELERELQLGRELNDVEKQLIANETQMHQKKIEWMRMGYSEYIVNQLADILKYEQETTFEFVKRIKLRQEELQAKRELDQLNKRAKDFTQSLEDQLEMAQRNNRSLTLYEETLRAVSREYQNLDPKMKQYMLDLAAQTDAVNELNRQHAELKEFFRETLSYVFEGNFKGLIENFQKRMKEAFIDKLSDWLATNVLGFDPAKTNNPVARPIVDKLDKTNNILNQILVKLGGTPSPTGMSGGVGGILNTVLGGILGGGSESGRGSIFNQTQGATGSINANGEYVVNGSEGGGSIFDRLKTLFGDGKGGIFGPRKTLLTGKESKWGGRLGGIGDIMAMVGGFLPGRAGTILSSVGSFMSMGATIGGPIGAGVGAVVGLIAGIFGSNKQRRKEEQARNQAMLDAFDALKQFDTLINDVRTLRIDAASGISQGESLATQVRSQYLQFANSLKDKKTRRHALADVHRIDAIITQKMAELRAVADVAKAAGERERRMLPEFAGGVYMSPAFQAFRRYNGMIGGSWTGRDVLPAMLAHREMVLNPTQQNRVIQMAGFDVFKTAGIPGYNTGIANPSPVAMAPIVVTSGPVNVTVVVEQDVNGLWHATAQSDSGQKAIAKIVEKRYANDELRLKRR